MNKPADLKGKVVKLRQIGNSVGVVIPKELLSRLRVEAGDDLHIVETAEGIQLQRYDPDFDEDLEIIDDLMSSYKNALRELAK
jgi:putative addiction module antidote